jgi:hypothetical protein
MAMHLLSDLSLHIVMQPSFFNLICIAALACLDVTILCGLQHLISATLCNLAIFFIQGE